jgi:hypothetical protein
MNEHKSKLVQNWRELLKEWGVIVLGVLTALLAEQAVQSIEWHHKVDAAVADMNSELGAGDGPQSYVRVAMHDCVTTRLNRLRETIERGDRIESRRLIDAFWLPKRTYDSLARDAATASDVASHMPHKRMLQYRIAYDVVPDLQRLADKELTDLGHLGALPATGGPIETSEKLAELDAIEALKLDNDAVTREARFVLFRLRAMSLQLDRYFVTRDVREASTHYDGCLTTPIVPAANPHTVAVDDAG